jgi:excinuclease ABC subunit B
MRRAIDETDRRRTKQQEHNKEHGITPVGVKKSIRNSIDDKQTEDREQHQYITKVAEEQAKYAALTPKQLAKRLHQMEQAMYRHAQNLEFEEAAAMRNEIQHIRSVTIGPESA